MASPPVPAPTARRVLVVDDNIDAAETLGMLLELSGHQVSLAHSGPDAVDAVRSFAPDLVFLDIGLPGLDGYGVARAVRGDASITQPRLVALTGWGTDEDRRRAREAGFDGHLVKPVEAASVTRALQDF